MREIKFRAWDKEHEEMIGWEQYKDELVAKDFSDDNLVIMQYTGLKDIKGVEIYEGDIVRYRLDGRGYKFINLKVKYLDQSAGFYLTESCGDRLVSVISMLNANVSCEIIGNIYENPELIKEED